MRTLRVHDVLKDRVLVSRESARRLEDALRTVMAGTTTDENATRTTPVIVDFEGVEGVAPSFLDELLSIFESLIGAETNGSDQCLIIANPPTRLSLKFEAIARGHGMSVRAQPDGSWLLTDAQKSCE